MNFAVWQSAFTLFLSLLVESFPFLLLGVLLSSTLLLFIDEGKLTRILPKHPLWGAIVGSLIGFLFPVCECGNVPVARRLIMQGIPPSVCIAFLLAAPTLNPVVIWATWTAFRDQPEVVLWRVGLSFGIATAIAWIFSVQQDLRPFLHPAVSRSLFIPAPDGLSGTYFLGESQPLALTDWGVRRRQNRWALFWDNTVGELRELGGVLVLGSALAAIIQVIVPREIILELGQGPVSSIVAMMTLAGVVSICSTVDAFFALSFASTFTTGSLLAFLVFGPMIDLKAIGLLLTLFRRRAIIYLFLLAGQMTFLAAMFINLRLS
ncbi:MAG: permease [Pseudanabaenaceae cyanobacterium SKYGB_i_bin29]|nr:permease [Pseudanabaenaceae cyanobacterium SKYG29]MDW8421078.1 permease [Pseudanabaenaceae cyanobacterium SKYGB_i_bin29]